ncbi:hypothetical protein ACSBR1_025124 [Camellia fascicularis]
MTVSSEQMVYEVVLKQASLVKKRHKTKENYDVKPDVLLPGHLSLLSEAYDRCGEVCAEYAKTFYLGTLLMTPKRRRAIWAIYGPVELAAVGVSIAVFNQASRIAIFPLVSVTTSFVAEEDTLATASPEVKEIENLEMGLAANSKNKKLIPQTDPVENTYKSEPLSDIVKSEHGKRKIPSASSALFIGNILGLVQTIFLILAAKPLLNFMGVKSVGLTYATTYTTILDIKVSRCSSCPPFIGHARSLSWIQGHKNSFMCHYGWRCDEYNSGPNIYIRFPSRYLISIILLWRLWKQVDLLPPSFKHMQFSRFLKNGFLLLMRVIAVTFCVTLAASRPVR